ncbi:endonuclease/exonuclease/phosphatase family protein [Streptomyces sp. NPDC001351]|uniref:endonuclease/exonuclease/phosphatase family protein n=1 Tax=Streptomyces sp. NPDC001351 TaxID=3364564 RepID=UPI0036794014
MERAQVRRGPAGSRKSVRLATFNVLHGRQVREGGPVPPSAADAERPLAEAVASLDADVVSLQEVDRFQERSGLTDQARVAAEAARAEDWRYASALHGRSVLGQGWVLDPSEPGLRVYGPVGGAPGAAPPSHGIALLSRLPVREWRAVRLAPAPLGMPLRVVGRPGLTVVRDRPRAALAAVLQGRRGPFTAVAVHLSFVPGWNARQLLALRALIADLPRPHLLLGDFNLIGAIPRAVLNAAELLDPSRDRPTRHHQAPSLSPRRRRRQNHELRQQNTARRYGWRDLASVPTYPSHRPVLQFDHVLASGLPQDAVYAKHAPPTPISDHRPLVVDLRV